MLRAVFVDFDDTLHDFASAYAAALERSVAPLCARTPLGPTPKQVRLACEQPWRQIWERYMARVIDEEGLWTERVASALVAAGVRHDAALAAELRAQYHASMEDELRLFPDALPALDALTALRPRPVLGVLTNGPAVTQHARLTRLGLLPRFDLSVISGEIGCAKPAQAFFAEALRRAGDVPPGEAVMIGDNPVADIAGARAAGLRAVWLNRAGAAWPADLPAGPDATAPDLLTAAQWVQRLV